MRECIRKIQDYLFDNKLDAFFITTKLNRQYLSGFTGSAGVLAVTRRGAVLYVDDRYLIRARRESEIKVLKLASITARGRVGLEDQASLREFMSWKKKFPAVKWRPTSDIVENLRAVKAPRELAAIKKGAAVIDKIFGQIRKFVRPGMTEAAVALEIERLAAKFGADGLAFEPVVAWGINAAAPHHRAGKTKLGRSNFLLLDFGVKIGDYHSDFTRTLFLGRPRPWQEKIYNIVLAAQKEGLAAVRGARRAGDIDKIIRNSIAGAGYGRYFTHGSGHGVGLAIHELPNFSPESADVLRAGMVATVEPGIYIEGRVGVRIEDMAIVKEKGCEVLSKSSKDLKNMIIH